jgi:ATP-dependent Zn protease
VLRKRASLPADIDPDVGPGTRGRITTGRSRADRLRRATTPGCPRWRRSRTSGTEHPDQALATAVVGHARTSREVAAEDRDVSAVHEAGHALVAFLLP